jgi:RNA polymerase sigma-70 factor (ECF subfamily)
MPNSLTILMEDASFQNDEVALIRSAQQNPARFKPLYLRWVNPVYQYLFFIVRSKAEAEDLTSQVFLKACEQLPRYRHQGCFSGWLFTIARNTARDHFRKSRRELPLEAAGEPAVSLDLLDRVIHTDELQRLDVLIRSLPEDELELIQLRYVAGLTYREIGMITRRSEDAARKSLSRLLSRLNSQLQKPLEVDNGEA